MRALVTGGAGFIGSAVCRLLAGETGWSVLNLDKLTYASSLAATAALERLPHYRFVQGDIADRSLLAQLLAEFKPDAILHLAAETHVDRSITGSRIFVETNIAGTHALLEESLAYWRASGRPERFRFLHTSTDEVFGDLGQGSAFTESAPYAPRSPYAASKAASDHLVRAWCATFGLPAIVASSSNNYGPYQFPEKLVPLTLLNALEGKPVNLYGDGLQVRDWLHVEDHARALRLLVEHGRAGETYVIGGRSPRANLSVVQQICDLLDEMQPASASRRGLIAHVEDRPGHDRRYEIDCTKIETEIVWRAETPFESGLRQTVRWYLAHEEWWRPIRAAFKGERLGLPS